MAINKRQIFFDSLECKNKTVLASIWHHFLNSDEQLYGYKDDEIIKKSVIAQQKFYKNSHPDFTKIMSDAFLIHPSVLNTEINSVQDLKKIASIGKDNEWITKQVAAVKEIVSSYQGEIASIYNIFAPAYYFRLKFDMVDEDRNKFPRLVEEDPYLFSLALEKIADDIVILVEKLIQEAKIDGIYLCVQSVQSPTFSEENYRKYIEPSQLRVLNAANSLSDSNVLHICGFEGRVNDLRHFSHYPVKAVNWATFVEKVTLEEGKKIFPGKALLGGFDNTTQGALYKGVADEIEKQTCDIIAHNGKAGLLLGADCSVPKDIDFENIRFAAKIANRI
ncbi:uroporphyrinogen decarboxylase [Brenneria izadpanahii]|uniref:Uroporphyrinogen decarboxylase n=1 Tax=Brenneria izadpanahii TaxID=2722756 RepID=A0ABX7URE0_9GAMM|nr:uroporphyrinogen decarboxylase family protein [Brenneria izadpanahii]QTF07855.1 uroporphyrinogen decarboxylase [Brenneria izadpanahii]